MFSSKPTESHDSQQTRHSSHTGFCYPLKLHPAAFLELMAATKKTTIFDLPVEILTTIFSYFYDAFAFDHDTTIFSIMRVCPGWFSIIFDIYWVLDNTKGRSREHQNQRIKSMIRAEKYPAIPAYARRAETLKRKEKKRMLEASTLCRPHASGHHHQTRTLRNAIALTNAAVYESIMGYHAPLLVSGTQLHHMPAPFQKFRRYRKTSSARIASWRGNNAPRSRDSDARYDFADPKIDNDLLLWEPGKGWLVPDVETAARAEVSNGGRSLLAEQGPMFRSWGMV